MAIWTPIMDFEKYVQEREKILKQWVQKAIVTANLSVPAVGEKLGLGEALSYKIANPGVPENHLAAHNLPLLIKETGDFFILDQFEAMLGRVAIPVSRDVGSLIQILKNLLSALEDRK
jgi:hypothetical protein